MYYIIFIKQGVQKVGNGLITICTFLYLHNTSIAITDNNRMKIC